MTLYEQRLSADLQTIRNKVQDIAERVCAALEHTIDSIADNNRDGLNQVVMDDFLINQDIRCIDKRCHEFVACHLPAAGHLRFISSVLRLTIALERAGDYAVTISRVVLQLSKPLPPGLIEKVRAMSEISIKMLADATRAFLSGDPQLATETKKLDYRVDEAYDNIFSTLMEDGKDRSPRELVSLLKIFSKVERFSDQAKNICEEAVFAATGRMKAPKTFKMLFLDERNDLLSQLAEAIARKAYPERGIYNSAGWQAAKQLDPKIQTVAQSFGLDLSRARPFQVGSLTGFPTEYHLVIALNAPDVSVLPELPYHTILRNWQVPMSDDLADVVRDLSSRIQRLMERLRGKNGN